MHGLISLAVKRPITIIMIFTGISLFGFISAFSLGMDFLPDIVIPRLVIAASYPGLPPEQVREMITIPLEDALTSLKGIKKISSISREGISTIETEFHWGVNMDLAAVEAREIIDTTYPILPSETRKPLVLPVNPDEMPVLTLAVFPRDGDLSLARSLAERELKTRLQQVEGVGAVILAGGNTREVRISVDQALINARGITLDQIIDVLRQSNMDFPAGSFKEGITEYIVKTEGKVRNINDLGELFIQDNQGARVKLKTIATIALEDKEQRSLFHAGGQEAVALVVHRKGGMSPVTLSRNIRNALEQLRKSYAADLEITIVRDSSVLISSSIRDLIISALSGAAISFLVIIFYLRNLKVSLILNTSLPFSILTALLLMQLTGMSINIMSLGGLALGIGMIVDNSTVVLENLQKHLPVMNMTRQEFVIKYTHEMAGSTFGSTATSLVVFIPIVFLPGITGALFTDLAITVTFSMLASFIVSITLVPVLFLLSSGKSMINTIPNRLEYRYRQLLRCMLRKPLVLIITIVLFFVPGILAFLNLRYEFMPLVQQQELEITVTMPPGTSMKRLNYVSRELAKQIQRLLPVSTIFSRAGGEENDTYYLADPESSREIISLYLKLAPHSPVSANQFRELLKLSLFIEEAVVTVNLPGNIITTLLGIKSGETLFQVAGGNPAQAAARAEEALTRLSQPGTAIQVSLIPAGKRPQIRLVPDRNYIAQADSTLAAIARTLGTAITGLTATQFTLDGKDLDVRVLLKEQDRATLESLGLLKIRSARGTSLFLKDLVTLTRNEGTPSLLREDRQDVILIKAAYDPAGGQKEMKRRTAELTAFPYITSLETSELDKNLERIIMIFLLILLLLYLILGAQFESFLLPLFLMLSLPLSFTGIFTGLWIMRMTINLNSIMGILVLLGIAVNNSIVLFEKYKQSITSQRMVLISVYRGSSERLRPIIITMMTTVVAMVPIAIDFTGTQIQSSMAVAIIGGLFVSTTITLFVTPLVFRLYFNRKAGSKS